MSHCGLLRRWWHARMRRTDLEMIGQSLMLACKGRIEVAEAAWARFLAEPGQDHWHCDCSPTAKELLP